MLQKPLIIIHVPTFPPDCFIETKHSLFEEYIIFVLCGNYIADCICGKARAFDDVFMKRKILSVIWKSNDFIRNAEQLIVTGSQTMSRFWSLHMDKTYLSRDSSWNIMIKSYLLKQRNVVTITIVQFLMMLFSCIDFY